MRTCDDCDGGGVFDRVSGVEVACARCGAKGPAVTSAAPPGGRTPGRWAYSPLECAVYAETADDRSAFVCDLVAVPSRSRAEVDANGYLLAAAPDLLEALQEAEAMLLVAMRRDLEFDRDTQTTIIDGHAGMVKIRAAIAKAKGESK